MSNNPTNLAAVPPKTMANGATPQAILQPSQQMALVATPTDLATSITAITAIKAGLIAAGLMKSS
jgi:hypothetical protein